MDDRILVAAIGIGVFVIVACMALNDLIALAWAK
jgi:hypothetical protein